MDESNSSDSSDAEPAQLEDIMAAYVEQVEGGEEPRPEAFVQKYPQHADELRSFFRNYHWLAEEPAPQPVSLVGTQVGDYTIETEIARGGMGVVYRARQEGLARPVALKLISTGVLAGEEERRRFRVEAEAAARLDHPGIIAIHETGSWQGYEFFSMTLVEGHTLQQVVDDADFNHQESARLVRDVTEAVAYAHSVGIVHRDLKPENILIGSDGRPMVTDFGLAKWQREGSAFSRVGITRTGQVLGTPHYMSPEQASGRSNGDVATDVYSLGALLYALLTGQPPHTGGSAAEILCSVLQDDPIAPRQIRREVPADLESICLKAMRHEPEERYESATALAEDLDRYLTGEATRAASSGLLDVVARELRRDQHEVFFRAWGGTLYALGGIVFGAHVVIYVCSLLEYAELITYWLPRFAMLALIVGLIYRSRGGSFMPRTVAERPVYSIWIGYLASLAIVRFVLNICEIETDVLFPIAAALSGFGFIAMGGHVWGGSAVLGLGFLAVAILSAFFLKISPLLFGTMWLLSLLALGRHYRSRATQDAS